MDVAAIYARVVWNIYGDSTPPASVVTYLQGADGAIARAHRDIQTDWNYYFMEASSAPAVVSGVRSVALPTRFKKEIALKLYDPVNAVYKPELIRLGRGGVFAQFQNATDTADYPQYYEIWNGNIDLWPMPSENSVLNIRYYNYLATLTLTTDHDALTDDPHGAEAIIARVVMDFASNIEYADKYEPFMARYNEAIRLLREKDQEYKRFGQDYVNYWSI